MIWKGLLLVIGLFSCLGDKKREVSFSERLQIYWHERSVLCNVVIMTFITVLLSFVVGHGNIHAKFALFGTLFNLISTFTLLLLFVPKVNSNKQMRSVKWHTGHGRRLTRFLSEHEAPRSIGYSLWMGYKSITRLPSALWPVPIYIPGWRETIWR